MDDTISRQALKEWIENWFTKNRLYHPYAKNNNIPITELYDILEQMPSAQQEQRWIPLSERTPEMDERVLVLINGCDYYVWDCMSNRGESYFWEDEDGLYHNKYEVNLWMPLPEPYDGEES